MTNFKFGHNVIEYIPTYGPIRLWDAQVEWARLQPSPNEWNWDRLDSFVNRAPGRQIVLVLGHPPAWAAKGGPDGNQAPWMPPGSNRPPANAEVWRTYVREVSRRYEKRISHYQIWNEPVDKHFYSGSYSELANYVSIAKRVIWTQDPKAKVISPPLQPRRAAGWNTKGKRLYRALQKEGFPFDIFGAHIYPKIGESASAWERDAVKVLRRIQGTKKPLWITETNFNLLGPNNPYPEQKQKRIIATVQDTSMRLGIERVFWYAYNYPNPSMLGITRTT